ncbi:hypothetical protein EW146_g6241 [Bondarzewia mesenterica]|uniref:ER-bound oxygenase mpaB/mpaB'/Rubber oxygenase catalytic domain-containing protein n=1 Tax=Bondarzewia mesenterica TaxID=1095465 RepID=A0A4S4LR15_9AGAM|nr:hypothetical protein EW146_g6241 [Bondarzewia mesenterica]
MVGPQSGATLDGLEADIDPRGSISIARINWLHGHYRISDDDMLYTLSCFIFEPMLLAEKYEWRSWSEEEQECLFILWKEIGRRMGIKDIPTTGAELKALSKNYEDEQMVPSQSNHKLAMHAINHISSRVPDIFGLRSFIASLFISLLDDHLREAMMLPDQPEWVKNLLRSIFVIRAFIVKHLMLPRTTEKGYVVAHDPPSCVASDGLFRLFNVQRRHCPWYIPVPTGWKYVVEQIKIKLNLADPNLCPGPYFKAEGYRLEELGPIRFEQDGHAEVLKNAEAIHGGPIRKPWAR